MAYFAPQYAIRPKQFALGGSIPNVDPKTGDHSPAQAQQAAGRPIVGCGAGTGISAKFAEAGGADLIIIYNSGRFRMAGRGSLSGMMPYGDANAIVVEMSAEVLPVVQDTPVLAGVCGTDPFRLKHIFLKQLKEIGFSGVQNFPTVGLLDGNFPPESGRHRHGL